MVGERIEKLRRAKDDAERSSSAPLAPLPPIQGHRRPPQRSPRLPDLSVALHRPRRKRQVFEAFGLQITYDKLNRRIEISATITQAIAEALENAKKDLRRSARVAQRT